MGVYLCHSSELVNVHTDKKDKGKTNTLITNILNTKYLQTDHIKSYKPLLMFIQGRLPGQNEICITWRICSDVTSLHTDIFVLIRCSDQDDLTVLCKLF